MGTDNLEQISIIRTAIGWVFHGDDEKITMPDANVGPFFEEYKDILVDPVITALLEAFSANFTSPLPNWIQPFYESLQAQENPEKSHEP